MSLIKNFNQGIEKGVFKTMIVSGPVIIQERNEVLKTLLVKHGDKSLDELKWKFCGGKLLQGSSLEENTIREAHEEIGLDIKIVGYLPTLGLWQEVPESGEEKPELIVLVHYLAEIYGEPVRGLEIKAMDWFDINNLSADIAPNVKPIIDAYKKMYLKK